MKRSLVLAFTFAAGAAGAETWIILPNGSGDAPSIRAAVDSAAAGDEIVLANGTFSGSHNTGIDFDGKAITIRSMSGDPTQCIVDCEGSSGGFLFWEGEGPSSVLEGIEIVGAGGYSPYDASAVSCIGTSPIVRNMIVSQARFPISASSGGSPRFENIRVEDGDSPAIQVWSSAPTITGCVIAANAGAGTWPGGPAVFLDNSDATIDACRIEGNQAGGIEMYDSNVILSNCRIEGNGGEALTMRRSSPVLQQCVIVGNVGPTGGILVHDSFPTLERCTITRNYGTELGGGFRVRAGSIVDLQRTIVWGNCAAGAGGDIYVEAGSVVNAACSDIRRSGVEGVGILNASADVLDVPPNFCDPSDCTSTPNFAGDYTVDDDSPVVTAPCGMMGALAANCTIHVERTSWGAIKALYR